MSDEFKEPVNIPGTEEHAEHNRKLDEAVMASQNLAAALKRKAEEEAAAKKAAAQAAKDAKKGKK